MILRGRDGSLLHYGLGTAARVSARETRDSFMLTEVGWFLINTGRPVPASRSDFLAVLADIEAMYVRASVSRGMMSSRLWKVTLDISVAQMTGGPPASDIEECLCPPQYSGTSCESCHQVSKQTKYFHLLKYFHCKGYERDEDSGACVEPRAEPPPQEPENTIKGYPRPSEDRYRPPASYNNNRYQDSVKGYPRPNPDPSTRGQETMKGYPRPGYLPDRYQDSPGEERYQEQSWPLA